VPGTRISEIEIISPGEKQLLLYDFNNAPGQYPKIKTIPQLFEEQTAQTPNVIALVASETREKHEKHVETLRATSLQITYFELNRQADQAEGALNEKGVLPDTIVAIMMERSIEMIIAIMSILKAGGAYLPIDPEYPQERIDYMLKDSKAKFLVTEKFFRGSRGAALQKSPPCSSNLAYVIYTSGSTGKPKGVLTTHANVIRVVKNTNYIEIKGHDRLLQLSNYAFDGSVFDIFGALLNQAALILPGKEHVSSAPILANLIQKENITIFFVTTALFNILVDEAPWAFKNTRKVLFGGERVSVEHVEKALAHLGKERIIHMYGPTETTVYATYYLIDEKKEGDRIIPIGKPVSDTSIYILDNSMNLAPIGVSGELYIAGGGTARGYLNNPELTNDRFIFPPGTSATRNPFEKGFLDFPKLLINHQSPITNHQLPIYKTGDLARWLSAGPPAGGDSGGVIEFLGRIDSQVKIRGFRIEIGEIENRLLKHKAVKEAFVTIGGKAGDKYLCAYYVLHKDPGNSCDTSDPSAQSEFDAKKRAAELKEYLAQTLPAYMVPAYMISMEKFPLTPNGKIDKKKLPGPDIAELAGVYVPPGDETEEKLVQIWSEVLGIDSHIIGINTNFFQLGGHSLKAIVMVDKIQINFQVKILLTDLFQRQSIKELADYIKIKRINREIQEPDTLEPVEIKEYYTLTPEQERMFELHRFYGYGNRIFNMPWIGELEPENETNLEKAFRELIQRHESLRTSFLLVKGKPVQVIHKQVEFAIEKLKLNIKEFNVGKEKKLAEVIESTFFQSSGFIRAFDLSRAPLLRVGMTKMRNGKLLLMIDMHHIISDGTSYSILLKELNDLLKGKDSPPLKIQYKDYIQWQASEKKQKVLAKQEVYWLNLLSKPAPALTLPIDFPRPAIRGMAADVIDFELDQQLVKALRKLAKQQSSSFFMIMLALFNVLLFKLTAQEDILVSTFFAGRRNPDLRKMVGMFVKTLLLRNCPAGEKQFIPFLNEVKQQTLNAYENQDYSCERLLKTKTFNREKSFPAVNFVLQNMDPTVMLMSGFQVLQSAWADNKNKNETRVTFYDLRFEGFELGERLIFNVEYDINLFTEETINKFISDFKKIISSVLKNPWQEIAAL
ncbi:MAG: amino acid adenylation domain-containing protein, partial [Acidobacteria bacterium]|nr:amino acid adenylation domain-containing protein [Acidobacteriota bacterium]